jgi:hypothetical protein
MYTDLGMFGKHIPFSNFRLFFKNQLFNFLTKVEKLPLENVLESIHANFHENWSSRDSANHLYLYMSTAFLTCDHCECTMQHAGELENSS